MKRLLSLILFISSFACAMDKGKEKVKETTEQGSQVASLLTICANQVTQQINNISLEEFLQAEQPQLPQELDCLVSSQLLKNNPFLISTLLQRATIPCLCTITSYTCIISVAINSSGTKVVTSSFDGTAKIWDINSGQCLHTLTGHTDSINSVAISSDKVVTGSSDRTAKIWDINSGQCLQTLTCHTDSIKSVAISSDKVVTGSWDRTAKIWDINSGKCLQTLTCGHTDSINSVAISSDKVVTGSSDGTAKIWDINSGKCLQSLTCGHANFNSSVAISSDKVVTGSTNGSAKIWDMTKFNTLYNYLHNEITIEQVLLLKDWHAAQQINQKLDLSNPQIKEVFDSLPDEIKKIISAQNIITRITNYCYNHPYRTAVGLGAAALTGYGLWKYFKNDN